MKKLFLLFLSTFVYNNIVEAQLDHSLLWKISGNGLEQPSYLFGTIHLICPEQLELFPEVLTAMEQSQRLVLELDMDEPSFLQETQKLSVNEGMQNLSGMLSEEELSTVNDFFTRHYNMDMSQLGILRPITLLSMITVKGLDCPQPASFELKLMEIAKGNQWEVLGLETLEEQFGVFDQMPVARQLEWIVEYTGGEQKLKDGLAKLTEAYLAKDLTRLLALMDDYPEYKDFEGALLFDRNEKWIDSITSMAKDKATFFAVGAAHLPSDKGVIKLLRAQGYEVAPVFN